MPKKPAPRSAPRTKRGTTRRKPSPKETARIAAVIKGLEKLYPEAHCELDFKNPFELLIATILSAQCTDQRVNMVTPKLFARFPDAYAMAEASSDEIEQLIKSTGFYRNKTKSILGASRLLVAEFDGVVPSEMDELLKLPGVARKTANVLLGTAFGKDEGFVVDTHIGRLARRLHLTKQDDPVKVETDLCAVVPQAKWTSLGHQLIWHGRRVCAAQRPKCPECALAPNCPSFGLGSKTGG